MSESAWPRPVATGVVLTALLIASSAPAAGATVAVESTTDCPTAADVTTQIERFVPPGAPMGYRLILSAGSSPESLQVSLLDRGGDVLRQRTTPLLGTCAALAEEIAVLAATWLGELPAPEVRVLEEAPVQPAVVTAATAPALAESVYDGAQAAPGQSGLALSAGAGVSTPAAFWIAPALTVRALWHARDGGSPFLAVGLFANLPREKAFAEGTPSEFRNYWYRLRITAAAGYRWQSGRFHLSLEGGAGGGYLFQTERGPYSHDYRYGDFALLAECRAGVALSAARNAPQLWLAAHYAHALKYNRSDLGGPAGRSPQSPVEIGLIVGTDISLGE